MQIIKTIKHNVPVQKINGNRKKKESEDRFNEMYIVAKSSYPQVADFFVRFMCNDRVSLA